MPDHLFASSDDYHYDNSGYYGYVVFNGDERALNGLRNALGQGRQSHGLGWYRYGKSFRPANDGRMYDWYIRLHSGGNEKPAAKAVAAFLKRFLKPAQPAARPEDRTSTQAQLSEDLQRLQTDIARETAAHQEAFGAHQRLDALLGKLGRIDIRFSEDLENLRRDLQDIADTWRADQWSNLNLGSIIRALDEVNLRLTEDLTRLQRDYNDITSAHADTLRAQGELAQVLERLKEHDRHISEDLARLQQDVQRLAERDSQDGEIDGREELLTRFDALGKSLDERIGELERAVQSGTAAQAKLEEMRLQRDRAEQAKELAENALSEAESALETKQGELIALQSEGPGDQFWHQNYNELETRFQNFKKKNKSLEDDAKDRERELKKIEQERDNYFSQFLEANKRVGELQKAVDEKQLPGFPAPENASDNHMSIARVVDVFLPDLDLVQESWNNLLTMDFRLQEKMLGRLRGIVWDSRTTGAKRVAGAKEWMELREGDWRIYYCRKRDQSVAPWHRAVILIGRKTEQEKSDIPWLKANPAKSFFE